MKLANGMIVVLLEPRMFPALTDEGLRAVTMNAGLAVQVTKVDACGIGLEVRKGAFMTWVDRRKVREASADERSDFMIATGDQAKPKKAHSGRDVRDTAAPYPERAPTVRQNVAAPATATSANAQGGLF